MFPCHRGSCQVLHIWNSCKQSRGSWRTTAESSRWQWGPPASQQPGRGKGWKCRAATWSPDTRGSSTLTYHLFLEATQHARTSSVPGKWRQELATDTLLAAGLCLLLRFLEPLLTKPPNEGPQAHLLCPWAIITSQIPTWKSHPPSFISNTKAVS